MPPLDYRTDVLQVERALVERLQLALLERVKTVADEAELRGLDAKFRSPGDLVFVSSLGRNVRWVGGINDPDNSISVFQSAPWVDSNGRPRPGRWVLTTDESIWCPREDSQGTSLCAIRSGYLRSVELYQGTPGSPELFNRFTGRRPLLAVRYLGDDRKLLNTAHSMYRVTMHFQLVGLSFHPRRGAEVLEGSDIPREMQRDPGLWRILGDAEDAVLGQPNPQSGYVHLVTGVTSVLPKGRQIIQELLAQRLFVGAVNIDVVCNVHRPDTDTVALADIGIQPQHVVRGEPLDGIYDDLGIVWPFAWLQTTVPGGAVQVGGKRIEMPTLSHVFPANAQTYRYATATGWEFVSSTDGAAPPSIPGALLVGCTSTDGSSIVFDEIITNYVRELRPVDVGEVEETHG